MFSLCKKYVDYSVTSVLVTNWQIVYRFESHYGAHIGEVLYLKVKLHQQDEHIFMKFSIFSCVV